MGIFSEIEEIEGEIAKISGVGNIGKLRQLEYSVQLFQRNYEVLTKLLNQIIEKKDQHADLFNRINRWRTEFVFKEISFRLHNFVASSLSLVDHSRIVYKKSFADKEHYEVYQKKVNCDLKGSEIVQFVQKLRQMCQHYRLPYISAELNIKESNLVLYLHKTDLLEFDGWNKKAKKFLKNSGDQIDLQKIVNKYHEVIIAFHKWAKKEFAELYEDEIMNIYEHNQKINKKKSTIIIEELESALKSEEKKILYNIKFAISGALPTPEMLALSKYEKDTREWILKSINFLKDYVEIPNDLLQKIIIVCNNDES